MRRGVIGGVGNQNLYNDVVGYKILSITSQAAKDEQRRHQEHDYEIISKQVSVGNFGRKIGLTTIFWPTAKNVTRRWVSAIFLGQAFRFFRKFVHFHCFTPCCASSFFTRGNSVANLAQTNKQTSISKNRCVGPLIYFSWREALTIFLNGILEVMMSFLD